MLYDIACAKTTLLSRSNTLKVPSAPGSCDLGANPQSPSTGNSVPFWVMVVQEVGRGE